MKITDIRKAGIGSEFSIIRSQYQNSSKIHAQPEHYSTTPNKYTMVAKLVSEKTLYASGGIAINRLINAGSWTSDVALQTKFAKDPETLLHEIIKENVDSVRGYKGGLHDTPVMLFADDNGAIGVIEAKRVVAHITPELYAIKEAKEKAKALEDEQFTIRQEIEAKVRGELVTESEILRDAVKGQLKELFPRELEDSLERMMSYNLRKEADISWKRDEQGNETTEPIVKYVQQGTIEIPVRLFQQMVEQFAQ